MISGTPIVGKKSTVRQLAASELVVKVADKLLLGLSLHGHTAANGPEPTSRDVCYLVGIEAKADMALTAADFRLRPKADM
jgi:hypothetical protein